MLALTTAPTALADSTVLVKFAHPPSAPLTVAALGDDPVHQTLGHVEVVRVAPGETTAEALAAYRSRADVVYAEPNNVRRLLSLPTPNDPYYSSQWALDTISAVGGWSLFPGTYAWPTGAPLGIVDTGVDPTHEDLAGRITHQATCLGGCSEGVLDDPVAHGTHVAGITGAATNNGVGVSGLAFSSPIIAAKVFHCATAPCSDPSDYVASDSDVADGIVWAAQNGATAINLSLGGVGYSQTLCNAVAAAVDTYHAVVVAAAGNSSVSTPTYPAACPGTIGVAATDPGDSPSSFSNYGSPDVFVSAPGRDIVSTVPSWTGSLYASYSGTSMAAPFVTALAALIRSEHPSATVAQVRQILAQTSDKVGGVAYGPDPYDTCADCTWAPEFGYGRIDVRRALAAPLSGPQPAPSPPPPPPPSLAAHDTKPPSLHVYPRRGRPGRLLRLRYRVSDDRGKTAERILVYRRRRQLALFTRPLRATTDAVAYWVAWRAPRLAGVYRFCVRATDSSGNRTRLTCAPVTVR